MPVKLALFVAPLSIASRLATDNIRSGIKRVAPDAFELEIVDVFEQPSRALQERVLVTPTLLAAANGLRVVGDLSEEGLLDHFLRTLTTPRLNER
jgi:circadian clock protein KaiB